MKIQVEIEDFYLDNEDIEGSLKEFIIKSCVQSITKSIEKKIDDQIERTVKNLIEKSMMSTIQTKVTQWVKNGKIKGRYSSDKEVTLEEYIQNDFNNNSGYSSPRDQIAGLAKKFGDELKARYDLLFASQIVAKLNENGLLKEDAVKMLLQSFDKK